MSLESQAKRLGSVTGKLVSEEGLMSLVEHLTELRRRLIYVLIVLVLALVGGLVIAKPTYQFLLNQKPANGKLVLHTFSFWDGIGIYMQIAFVLAFVITIPFIVLQLWLFVKPALHPHEQRSTLKYVPFALLMALLGLAFAYFVVFPLAFNFTRSVSQSLGLEETFGVVQYFEFMFGIIIPITLLFELPLLIMFLTAIRIVNPIRLKKMRRLAYFIMSVIGVMITPPDFISDILVIIPLIVLYEISVWMSNSVYKKQLAKDAEWKTQVETSE
ncbi:twin-arginine translocase subunit TatC [Paenibacillus sp. FSL W7-1287]|uniref:twin-arginine translocase subunit TatC n=1 Tax=Paenibacillus sp. FSL W7-1287 TaxID=2954538 RepID=UPI0030F9EA96